MATAPVGNIGNLAGLLDPSLVGDQLANQQQQALANALLQQGLTPMGGTQMAGNVAIRNSPVEGLAKLVQILSGQNIQQTADQGASSLAARQSAALLPLYLGQQQPQQDPASAAMAQGAAQGAPGPTMQSAQAMNNPTSAFPGAQAGPLTMPGMNPMTAFVRSQMYPEAYGNALIKSGTPNDTSIQAMQGNMDPVVANRMAYLKATTDPKILAMQQAGFTPAQIYGAVYGEAAKNAEIDRKSMNQFYNPFTNQSGMVPKLPEGANPGGAPLADGSIPSVSAIPGSPGVIGTNQHATSANTIIPTTLSNGATVPMWGGQAAGGGTAATLSPPIPSGPQIPGQNPGAPPAVGGQPPIQPLLIGQSTTDKALQKNAADVLSSAPQIITQSKSANAGLQTALGIVEGGLKTGIGTSGTIDALALVNNLGIPLEKGDVNGYQTVKKLLQNSLNTAAAGTGASGSDARFESFSLGQPDSGKMNPTALSGAIRYVMSQNDAAIARSSFLPQATQQAQAAGSNNPVLAAQQAWAQKYEPQYFQFNRMSAPDQAAYIRSLKTPAARQDFVQGYNKYAQETGWVH